MRASEKQLIVPKLSIVLATFGFVVSHAPVITAQSLTAVDALPVHERTVVGTVAVEAEAAADEGARLYMDACATCHGADGAGASQHMLGFDIPVPDFTDCDFASREPDGDWIAVAHQGGPTRAFSMRMPAFGGVLSPEQLQLVMDHVRGFCTNDNWPRGELNLPRALITEKAFPEDEAVWTTTVNTEGAGGVENEIVYEQRFGARNQIELVLPMNWAEVPDAGGGQRWSGGHLGDVAVGVKRAFWHSIDTGSIFSLTGEVIFPTGDEALGFGKGTTVFEPFASFGQILPAGAFVHAQSGVELPVLRDKAGEEAFWRGVLGKTVTQGDWGRAWSPMVEILGARELESGAETEWTLVPQMQVTLNRRQHIMLNVGVTVPLDDPGRHSQVIVYVLWDWFDGGLWDGW